MKFRLFDSAGSSVWIILTSIVLLLFFIQSIWSIVDSLRPANPVTCGIRQAGLYKAVGGLGPGGATPPADGGAIDSGGLAFSIITLVLTTLLAIGFGVGVADANNLAAFNPFGFLKRK